MREGSAWKAWVLAAVCLVAAGCAHKKPRVAMPTIVSLPVEVLDVPEPPLPKIASVPAPAIKVPVASRVARDLRRIGRRPVVTPAPALTAVVPAVVPTATPATDATVIGSLTTGDESASTKQTAVDAIADLEKRLAGLPTDVLKAQQSQVVQVRDFVRKARESLDSGDASGAVSLATKARLLLDDLLK